MLVVILRTFTRPFTSDLVVDVAPITEDINLAADWSLVLPAEASGVRMHVVTHLDFQVTTSIEVLGRCIGQLTSDATTSLQYALEAYDTGMSGLVTVECGYFGQATVRNLVEWQLLQTELEDMIEDFSGRLPEEADSEFSNRLDEALETHTPREGLPRAPTSRISRVWAGGNKQSFPASWSIDRHTPQRIEVGSKSQLVATSQPCRSFAFAWQDIFSAADASALRLPEIFLRHAGDRLELSPDGSVLTCGAKPSRSCEDTLGCAMVAYLVVDDCAKLKSLSEKGSLPLPAQLQLVEKLPLSKMISEGVDMVTHIHEAIGGQALSPTTIRFIGDTVRFVREPSLRNAEISRAARKQISE